MRRLPSCIRKPLSAVKSLAEQLLTIPAFRAERKQKRSTPIRVGFFCQYIPAWTKVSSLYHQMKEDPRFEPVLLCLPSGIENNALPDPESLENDTFLYMQKQGYGEAINTLVGKDTWLDLESLHLAYIFYPRPYNPKLPLCYIPKNVCRYSRACILMYGMMATKENSQVMLNKGFMRYVYFYFAESTFSQGMHIGKNRLLHKLGLQKSPCLGYPVLEELEKYRNTPSASWDFSKNPFRVLWTPRWSTDKALGGSNFFTYKDFFLDYARKNPQVDILIRPHPLMFSNFLKTGEMTQAQVEDYMAQCASLPNLSLDTQSAYEATLWGSSVMVTDLSSIVPEFFNTGKPVIFCSTNMELELAEYFRVMLDQGCYDADSSTVLERQLSALASGSDPLKEARQALISKLFGSASSNATQNILEALAEDAEKRK